MQLDVDHVAHGAQLVLRGDARDVEVAQRVGGPVGLPVVERAGEAHLVVAVVRHDEVVLQVVQLVELPVAAQREQQLLQDGRVLLILVGGREDDDGLVDAAVQALDLRLQPVRLHVVRVDLQQVLDGLDHHGLVALHHLQLGLHDDQLLVARLHADAVGLDLHGLLHAAQLVLAEAALLERDFREELLLLLHVLGPLVLHFI